MEARAQQLASDADAHGRPHRRVDLIRFAALLVLAGCASGPAPATPVAAEDPPRPYGVVVQEPTELPQSKQHGRTGQGLLTLTPSTDVTPAIEVVDRFFQAVVHEREDLLAELFDPSGRMWAGRHRRQVSLTTAWSQRFARLDYTALAGSLLYQERNRELYLEQDARLLASERQLPMLPGPNEVLIRIRMSASAAGGSRLFGDEVVFLLRRDASGYRIAQMREDFRLP